MNEKDIKKMSAQFLENADNKIKQYKELLNNFNPEDQQLPDEIKDAIKRCLETLGWIKYVQTEMQRGTDNYKARLLSSLEKSGIQCSWEKTIVLGRQRSWEKTIIKDLLDLSTRLKNPLKDDHLVAFVKLVLDILDVDVNQQDCNNHALIQSICMDPTNYVSYNLQSQNLLEQKVMKAEAFIIQILQNTNSEILNSCNIPVKQCDKISSWDGYKKLDESQKIESIDLLSYCIIKGYPMLSQLIVQTMGEVAPMVQLSGLDDSDSDESGSDLGSTEVKSGKQYSIIEWCALAKFNAPEYLVAALARSGVVKCIYNNLQSTERVKDFTEVQKKSLTDIVIQILGQYFTKHGNWFDVLPPEAIEFYCNNCKDLDIGFSKMRIVKIPDIRKHQDWDRLPQNTQTSLNKLFASMMSKYVNDEKISNKDEKVIQCYNEYYLNWDGSKKLEVAISSNDAQSEVASEVDAASNIVINEQSVAVPPIGEPSASGGSDIADI